MSSHHILDSPISKREEEQLGRLQFVDSISNLILKADTSTSFRIGIYGDWGEGKTSVLKMVQMRLQEKGQPCVWLLPWAYADSEGLWTALLESIATVLEVDKGAFKTAQKGYELIAKARKASDIDWRLKVANAAFGDSIEKVAHKFAQKHGERLLPAIYSKLGSRRLTVFVDDVDRTRPELVPSLLLNLREALDLPGVFYVIGLSPKVVEEGLRQVHSGWDTANSFLEKVVEWPFHLPKPTKDQLMQFVKFQVQSQGSSIRADSLEGLLDFFPANPRKVKLFLRVLGSLDAVLSRFSVDEADVATIYMAQMLKMEFPNESYNIVENPEPITNFLSLQLFEKDETKKKEALNKLSCLNELQEPRRTRFIQLLNGLTSRWNLTHQYTVADTIMLIERPPTFTKKEVTELFETFKVSNQDRRLVVLKEWISYEENPNRELANALFVGMITLRNNFFSETVDLELEEDLKQSLTAVNTATELIHTLITDLKLFETNILSADSWKHLVDHVANWSAWRKPEYYIPIRDSELELLKRSMQGLSEEMQLEILDRTTGLKSPGQKTSQEFQIVYKSLSNKLEETVCSRILARFLREDGVEAFWKVQDWVEKDFAFDPGLPFHKSAFRTRLVEVSNTASQNTTVQKNFLTYFRMLAHGALEPSSFNQTNCQELLRDDSFRKALWNASLAKPLNPRTVGSLRGMKSGLQTLLGLDDSAFPTPKWWSVLEETFFREDPTTHPTET